MAKNRFVGGAQAISQITTLTIGGTWADTETVTIKVAEKSVTYTCGASETTTTVASGLLALCQASTAGEFTDITWTSSTNVITATSDVGVPVTITASEASAAGTITVATTQAATGPNHWDNAGNWSLGTVPVDTDDLYQEDENTAILYGLPTTTLIPNSFTHTAGQLGLPDRNTAGYPEYRTKRAAMTCTTVTIGRGSGNGPTLCRLDLGAAAATVNVFGSRSASTGVAIDLKLNNSAAVVNVISGQVGIAYGGDETSTVGTVRVSEPSQVFIGSGTTITTLVSSGSTELAAACTNVTVEAGTVSLVGTATIGTLTLQDGTLLHKSSGTITTANVNGGLLDMSKDNRPRTITNLQLEVPGQFDDKYNTATITTFTKGPKANRLIAT